jgi:hypothetical protein
VFNTVELVGKAREEAVALLGDPRSSSESIYNFSFWPVPEGTLVYRFDSGAYGWQFNLVIGEDGLVREIKRHWISLRSHEHLLPIRFTRMAESSNSARLRPSRVD